MKTKFKWTNSMGFVIAVAVILLIGALIVPMRTSLGQGIDERVIDAWYGVYNIDTGKYYFHVSFGDGSYRETPMNPIAKSYFVTKTDNNTLMTEQNLIPVIEAAYAKDKIAVQTDLGTYNNAPGMFHPFSDEPVAYSVGLLKAMTDAHFNPKSVGGPDVAPGSVPLAKLGGASLQIDTQSNGNTIRQCKPGQVPFQLAQLERNS
ncbi:hypothetical protein JZ785_24375 [Alicyclobacillus curvatus]|nr:hypothetical protein JZ785_24375 [Alicyclobacillus curvatus]